MSDLTVLVVEDDDNVRDLLGQALEMSGFGVLSARDGREALRVLDEHPNPVGIVLDMMMPGMNGWDFLAERAKYARLRDIPVVVISAAVGADTAARRFGCDYLPKPIQLDDLLSLIDRARRT